MAKDLTDTQDSTPEKFPLQRGMKGELIKDLQKELGILENRYFCEHTEREVIRLGFPVPLSEDDYKKIVKSEHIKIFEWIVENINKSKYPYHLDGCLKLVDFFQHRKYKKLKPTVEELTGMAESLHQSISTKRNTMHTQKNRDKKNNS